MIVNFLPASPQCFGMSVLGFMRRHGSGQRRHELSIKHEMELIKGHRCQAFVTALIHVLTLQ